MKFYKVLAAAALTLGAAAAQAQTITEPQLLWAKKFCSTNTATQSMNHAVARSTDGATYYIANSGSRTATEDIQFGDKVIGKGVYTSGNSDNYNMVLAKVANDGSCVWSAISAMGDFYNNEEWVAATADGGVLVANKFRVTLGQETLPVAIVDGLGDTTKIEWEQPAQGRNYIVALMKFASNGKLAWVRQANCDATASPKSTKGYISDGIDVYSLAVDDNQNIYVAGRFRQNVSFLNADGSFTAITPCNTAGWTDDSQTTNGDLFIAKFDADGYCQKTFVTIDSATYTAIKNLRIVGDEIYFDGFVKGRTINGAINPVHLGSIDLNVQNENNGILVGKLDLDLNVLNARLFSTSYAKSAYNTTAIDVIGSDVFLTGKGTFNINFGDIALDASSLSRDAYVVRLNSNLEPQAAARANVVQSGYMGAFVDRSNADKLYVFGHSLMGPLFIREYDRNTLSTEKSDWQLSSYAAAISPMLVVGDTAYIQSRFRNTVTLNESTSFTSSAFTAFAAAYKLPVKTATGINSVVAGKAATAVYGTKGAIVVNADEAATVRIFNITGAQVATVNAKAGTTTVSVPAGIYIANGTKVIVR